MLNWKDVINFSNHGNPKPDRRIEKTDMEWQQLLSEEEYIITRKKGTERAFSGELCNIFKPGKYACICCDQLLFDSGEKYDSNSGWPSFTQPIKENAIHYTSDLSHSMERVEVTCSVCDSHLGHVFPDGPAPSGLRYCINSVSIKSENN